MIKNQIGSTGLIILFLIALLGVSSVGYAVYRSANTPPDKLTHTQSPSKSAPQTSGTQNTDTYQVLDHEQVKLTGVVTGKWNDMPMDGGAGIIVNNKYRIMTGIGGDLSQEQRDDLVWGTIENVGSGDRVEVFGKLIGTNNNITLEGDKAYYLKKLGD